MRHGLLTTADRGTILLDEIGEMPGAAGEAAARARRRRGASGRLGPGDQVNVRVIAASNDDSSTRWRRHLSRGPLLSPAGRADRDPAAARAALRYPTAHRVLPRTRPRAAHPGAQSTISREAMVALWSYDWPGNVRELENMVERLVILCEGSIIDTSILPANLVASSAPATPRSGQAA